MLTIPGKRPQMTETEFLKLLEPHKIDRLKYPLIVIGIRGYYLNSLGKPGTNDREQYDDAIFVHSDKVFRPFNANCDPSKYEPGIASIKANQIFYAHIIDYHRGKTRKYLALCQRVGQVLVTRDGQKGYSEGTGMNVHEGCNFTTGSLGCSTIVPAQYPEFISLLIDEAKRLYVSDWDKHVIPYGVLEVAT